MAFTIFVPMAGRLRVRNPGLKKQTKVNDACVACRDCCDQVTKYPLKTTDFSIECMILIFC